ncbi:MAG: hypothetical protein AB7N54_07295 [Alphaproteobacteria bacterium]
MNTLESVQSELVDATAELDAIGAALAAGEPVDLVGFNIRIAEACKAAVSLPEGEMTKVRPQLTTLLVRLTETRTELQSAEARIWHGFEDADTSDEDDAAAPPVARRAAG